MQVLFKLKIAIQETELIVERKRGELNDAVFLSWLHM